MRFRILFGLAAVAALAVLAALAAAASDTAPRAPRATAAVRDTTTARATTAAPSTTTAPAAIPPPALTTTQDTIAARRPATARATAGRLPREPRVAWDPIPFGPTRRAQMVAYARRHYESFLKPTWRLIHPHVIVIHYTEASYGSTVNTFAADVPDSELHELPAVCAHFVIDARGRIHQLVSLGTMCRHTVGLNWTAIGIEHVGYSDAQVLDDQHQIVASLELVHWLRCRYGIEIRNVIGHNESLSSPYHHEDVQSLRNQTHGDFTRPDMNIYRARLRGLGGC